MPSLHSTTIKPSLQTSGVGLYYSSAQDYKAHPLILFHNYNVLRDLLQLAALQETKVITCPYYHFPLLFEALIYIQYPNPIRHSA